MKAIGIGKGTLTLIEKPKVQGYGESYHK